MRSIIAVLLSVTFLSSLALAQTGSGLALKPWAKDRQFEASADLSLFEDADIDETDDDLGLTIVESMGRYRVPGTGDTTLALGYDILYLDLDSDVLPSRLTDQSIGAGFTLAPAGGWTPAFTVAGGYAGDTPYSDGSAWYAKASASVSKRLNANSDLVLLLDYDGNRTIFPDFPIPGFVYALRLPEHRLSFGLGIPINRLTWQPLDNLTIELTALMWERLDVSIDYEIVRRWTIFGRFLSLKAAFNLDELEETNDRLLFEQRRAEAGVAWQAMDSLRLIVAGGYAFSQEFNVGFDSRDTDTVVELDDAPYVRVGLELAL